MPAGQRSTPGVLGYQCFLEFAQRIVSVSSLLAAEVNPILRSKVQQYLRAAVTFTVHLALVRQEGRDSILQWKSPGC